MKRLPTAPDNEEHLRPLMDIPTLYRILAARYPEQRIGYVQVRYAEDVAVRKFVAGLMPHIFGEDWRRVYEPCVKWQMGRMRKKQKQYQAAFVERRRARRAQEVGR